MARQRLLTDTYSVFMLLACGLKLFQKGALKRGDLVIHPQVWIETRKWHPAKKEKYRNEFQLLHTQLSFAAGPKVPQKELPTFFKLIEISPTSAVYSLGYSDKIQLASVLWADNIDLVTNDGPLQKVAESFGRDVLNAEQILLEALDESVISLPEAQLAVSKWEQHGEAIKNVNRPALRRSGIKFA